MSKCYSHCKTDVDNLKCGFRNSTLAELSTIIGFPLLGFLNRLLGEHFQKFTQS